MMAYRHNDMSRLIVLALVLAAGLLAGCARDVPEIKEEKAEISVTTNLAPMRMRANTMDSNSELQGYDIKIDAYYSGTETPYLSNETLHYSAAWMFWNSSTSTQLHYYWPIEGSVYTGVEPNITVSSLDFVGYCPFEKPGYIGTPTYNHSTGVSFTATMPTTTIEGDPYIAAQTGMNEFLVGIASGKTYAEQEASGGVPLQFKHPLAYIKFSLSEATTDNVTVNSISMEGLKTSGSCSFNGTTSTWSSQDGSAAMNLTETLQRHETEETSPFIVIPFTYEGTKTLSVNATWTEWGEVQTRTYEAPLTIDWVAGYAYTYTLTITKYELIVDEDKFTEQW